MRVAPPPAYLVDAADKALQLVLLLQATPAVSVSEAAAHLGVARSTAHRMLATLRYRGFAVQSGDRRYRAGPALRRGVHRARSAADLVELALPVLSRLRDEVDETVHVVVLDGRDAVFLHSEESRQPLRVGSRAGARLPARSSSGGRVLLAALDPAEVEALFQDELGAGDLAALNRELAEVRADGYGLDERGPEDGVSAVSVAAPGEDAAPIAALTVSVPAVRLTRAHVPELTAALRRAAAELTALAG
jgi:IclR family transcriptional regulator, acetate operon repressor